MLDNAEATYLVGKTSDSVVGVKDLNVRSGKKVCHVTLAREQCAILTGRNTRKFRVVVSVGGRLQQMRKLVN